MEVKLNEEEFTKTVKEKYLSRNQRIRLILGRQQFREKALSISGEENQKQSNFLGNWGIRKKGTTMSPQKSNLYRYGQLLHPRPQHPGPLERVGGEELVA